MISPFKSSHSYLNPYYSLFFLINPYYGGGTRKYPLKSPPSHVFSPPAPAVPTRSAAQAPATNGAAFDAAAGSNGEGSDNEPTAPAGIVLQNDAGYKSHINFAAS